MPKHFLKIMSAAAAVNLAAGLLFFLLPVSLAQYSSPSGTAVQPFGAITASHPLEACLPGGYQSPGSLEFYTATYMRPNTNNNLVTVYTLENGQKQILTSREFNSFEVPDNGTFAVSLEPVQTEVRPLCYSWQSLDGTDENAVTVWLNQDSNPVLKVKTTLPFYRALDYIQGGNLLGLPYWLAAVIAWLTFCAALTAIAAVAAIIRSEIYGPQKTS